MSANKLRSDYDKALFKAWKDLTSNSPGVEVKIISDKKIKKKYL
jgi:hypothetical protein